MTTIATDGVTIAADGMTHINYRVDTLSEQKIVVGNGAIYAMSGYMAMMPALMKWVEAGGDPDTIPKAPDASWTMLIIDKDGSHYCSASAPFISAINKVIAFGSGGEFALGAMLAGKTPREAVQLVIDNRLDIHTGGEVVEFDIKEALGIREPGLRVAKG